MRGYFLLIAAGIGFAAALTLAWLFSERARLERELQDAEIRRAMAERQVSLHRIATAVAQEERDRIEAETEQKYRPLLDQLAERNNVDEIDPDSDLGLIVCGLYPDLCGSPDAGPH